MRIQSQRIRGYTLLELLVVIALLAIVAAVAVTSGEGVNEQAGLDASRYEMAELRKALLQFRRDTGVFPGQGAYACDGENMDFSPYLAGASAAEKEAWCNSPANFWMLFECKINDDATTADVDESRLCSWNPDSRRGWNGPYLANSGPGYVDYGGEARVRGVADGYTQGSSSAWRLRYDDTEPAYGIGGPYLFFDPTDTTPNDEADGTARIVSLGPDGVYAGAHATDKCQPGTDGDDLVLCLLK